MVLNWLIEANYKEKWYSIKSTPRILLYILFYAVFLIGMLYTEDISNGVFTLEKKLSILTFPLVLGSSKLKNAQKRSILKLFVLSTFIALTYCYIGGTIDFFSGLPAHNFDIITQSKYIQETGESAAIWPYISYIQLSNQLAFHPTYLALYTVFALFILLDNYNWAELKTQQRILLGLTVTYFIVSVILLSSRIVYLAFIVSIMYWTIRQGLGIKRLVFLVSLVLTILILIYINPVSRYRVYSELSPISLKIPEDKMGWTSANLRILHWKSSLTVIGQNLLFGVGTGDGNDAIVNEYDGYDLGIFKGYSSHSEYLRTFLTVGLIGLTIFILNLSVPFWKARKNKQHLYVIFLILISICCLTESLFSLQKGVVFYGFFNSFMSFNYCKLENDR